MRIYLAGPMRGVHLFNFPAFFAAAMALREQGHDVLCPAERDMAQGFNPALPIDDDENVGVFSLAEAFEWDFNAIVKADAIVLLPDWRDSSGVQAELVLAHALQKPVYEWLDGLIVKRTVKGYTVAFDLAPNLVHQEDVHG